MRRGDRDVVEQAKAHRLSRSGVVARRSHQSKPALDRAIEEGVRECNRASRRELGDGHALWAYERVRIDVAVLAAERGHRLHEPGLVDAEEILLGNDPRLDRLKGKASSASGALDGCMSSDETLWALRVVGARAVLEKTRFR
jgi:hypothetical protein